MMLITFRTFRLSFLVTALECHSSVVAVAIGALALFRLVLLRAGTALERHMAKVSECTR